MRHDTFFMNSLQAAAKLSSTFSRDTLYFFRLLVVPPLFVLLIEAVLCRLLRRCESALAARFSLVAASEDDRAGPSPEEAAGAADGVAL